MSRFFPCILIFRRFFSIKSVKTMYLCDGVKNHIVTCENVCFGAKKGITKFMTLGGPKTYYWKDLYNIYSKDNGLSRNLNKAPKLSQALHPGNNKKSVPLVLLIHETSIAAARSCFPTRSVLSGFLNLINICSTIPNSKQRYTLNVLGNGIIFGDKETNFYRTFADLI